MIEVTRFGRSKPEYIQPDPMSEIIERYLDGELDADELDLYLDVKLRPYAIHRLVEQGTYDVWAARRAILETWVSSLVAAGALSLNDAADACADDGSIMFMGKPL